MPLSSAHFLGISRITSVFYTLRIANAPKHRYLQLECIRIRRLSIQVANITLASPVFLAPMAGITDLPFRKAVQRHGAGLVVSEMVASQEMVQAKPGVRERAELGFDQENTAVQLAGREAHWMAEAARQVEDNGKICIPERVLGGESKSRNQNYHCC